MAWEENKHPRAKNGQFASKEGEGFDDDNDFENWDREDVITELFDNDYRYGNLDEEGIYNLLAERLNTTPEKVKGILAEEGFDYKKYQYYLTEGEYADFDDKPKGVEKMSSDTIDFLNKLGYDFDADEETDFELTKDSKDESEAISGYDKTLKTVDNPHMRDQIEKIRDEEVAHKEYLDKAKTDPNAVYEDPSEDKEFFEWYNSLPEKERALIDRHMKANKSEGKKYKK